MKSRIRCGAFHPFWTFVIVIELLAGIQAALGQTPCATAPSGLVSWWRAEGNGADEIGTNHGTPHNGTGFTPGLVEQAFSFDGLNGYVQVPYSSNLSSPSYTVEAWVKPTAPVADSTGQDLIFGQSFGLAQLAVRAGTTGVQPRFHFGTGDVVNYPAAIATNDLRLNEYSHLVGTWNGTELKLYVNGLLNAQVTPSRAPVDSQCAFFIGGFNDSGACAYSGQFFQGDIDEVSYYTRALTTSEIQALYAAGSAGKCTATLPNCTTAPSGLVHWWRGEGDVTDSVGGMDGILNNGTTFTAGQVGSALRFDGVDDCVTNSLPGLTNYQDSFTMEFWAYPSAARATTAEETSGISGNSGQRYAIFPHFGGYGPVGVGVSVGTNGVSVFEHGAAYLSSLLVYDAPIMEWTHVAVVYTNRQPQLFLNGQLVRTGLTSTRIPYPSTWLGENGAESANYGYYAGLLDEISIYGRSLAAAEVQALYAAGSAGKCTATLPNCTTAPSGLVHWWRGEGDVTDSVGGMDGILNNGTTFTAGQVGSALRFDGVDDCVTNSLPGLTNYQDSFTMEFWAYPSAARATTAEETSGISGNSGQRYAIFPHFGGYGPVGVGVSVGTNGVSVFEHGAAYLSSLLVYDAPIMEWTHVAVVYTNRQPQLFLNGQLVRTGLTSTRIPYPSTWLGENGAESANYGYYAGLLDEISIYGRSLAAAEVQALYAAGSAGKCLSQPAAVYDVARGFSTNSNPAGIWSYGYSTALGGDITLHTSRGNDGGIESWFTDIWLGTPNVFHNGTAATLTNSTGTIVLEPGQLSFHPGPNGEFGLVRFTVPSNGWYEITAAFVGADTHGTTTDVYLMQNGSPFFSGLVNGFGPNSGLAFQTNLTLRAGDRVDFAVGRGSNQEFSFDSTGLSAQLRMITSPTNGGAPILVTQPQVQIVDAGANVSFTASALGSWPLSYQWFIGDSPISNGINATLTLTGVQPAQAGSYHVVVTNAYGAAVSSNALLTVLTYPPTLTLQPKSVTTYEGRTATFTAKAAGTAPLSYQWFFNGAALPGKTTTALTLANVQSNNAGYYWLTASNAYGFAASSNATLTVLPPPVCISAPTGAVAWWRGESNTLDSIGLNDALLSGSPYIRFYQTGKVGTAFRQSSSGYFYVPASRDLDVGAGDGFTVEGWILPSTLSYANPIVYWGNADVTLLLRSAGMLETRLSATNTGMLRSITLRSTNQAVQAGVWQHVALSFDKATGLTALFVNGAAVAQTNLTSFRPQTQSPVYLGSGGSGYPTFAGALDEFTIYGRALAPVEIQAIVAADEGGKCIPPPPVCAPPPAGLVAWWRGESNALDSVSLSHGVIMPAILFTNGVAGKAFQFMSGHVRVPASDTLNVGAGEGFTIETWVNRGNSTAGQPLVQWGGGKDAPGVSLATASSPRLQANIVDSQGGAHYITTPVNSLISGFQHVALTYDKASGMAALYIRGNLVTQTNLGSFTPRTASDLYLGYQPSPLGKFTGVLDEVGLYGRALTAAEIRGIALARGAGKCTEPPTILEQPLSLKVADGGTAKLGVVASGNPLLRYQWLKDGVTLPGETGDTLVLSNVQPAQAGTYCVLVTNHFGAALSSNAVLRINRPPTAHIVVSPLAFLPGVTNLVVIAPVCADARVVLDGSQSADPDQDPLHFAWTEGTNTLGTNGLTVHRFAPGSHAVTLEVSDGFVSRAITCTFKVRTPAAAIGDLLPRVQNARLSRPIKNMLLKALQRAAVAFENCQAERGMTQLGEFRELVRARVLMLDRELAQDLLQGVQAILDGVRGVSAAGDSAQSGQWPFRVSMKHGQGPGQIQFVAPEAKAYRVEASTNMVDWEDIGEATLRPDGTFEFEDVNATRFPGRFYRVVSP